MRLGQKGKRDTPGRKAAVSRSSMRRAGGYTAQSSVLQSPDKAPSPRQEVTAWPDSIKQLECIMIINPCRCIITHSYTLLLTAEQSRDTMTPPAPYLHP